MKRKLFVVLLLGALLTSCNSVDSSKETIVANDTNESAENNLTLKSIKEEKMMIMSNLLFLLTLLMQLHKKNWIIS